MKIPAGDPDPADEDLQALLTDEERRSLDDPDVPEEVKQELLERLERMHEAELEDRLLDEPPEI
jgi:hypothetical protein